MSINQILKKNFGSSSRRIKCANGIYIVAISIRQASGKYGVMFSVLIRVIACQRAETTLYSILELLMN